jgi:hypothetical protein
MGKHNPNAMVANGIPVQRMVVPKFKSQTPPKRRWDIFPGKGVLLALPSAKLNPLWMQRVKGVGQFPNGSGV